MKVIRYQEYGEAGVMSLAEEPDPVPGESEILVQVHAASVNPVDAKIRAGLLQEYFPLEFPVIPGRDGAGIVVGTGTRVTEFEAGDEVCFLASHPRHGACAERIALDADWAVAKPARLSFAEAAAFPSVGVSAWCWLVRAIDLEPGMKILIHGGAGGVGGMSIQLAVHLGADVAATCRAANADYVRGLGAARVIAYDEEDFSTAVSGLDAVFDSIGGEVHRRSYEVLRAGGTLVYLIADPIEDLSAQFGVTTRAARVEEQPAVLKSVTGLVADGVLVPQVGEILPWTEVAEAHRMIETGHTRGKIVLSME